MLCANATKRKSFESKKFKFKDSQSAIQPTEMDYSCSIGSDCQDGITFPASYSACVATTSLVSYTAPSVTPLFTSISSTVNMSSTITMTVNLTSLFQFVNSTSAFIIPSSTESFSISLPSTKNLSSSIILTPTSTSAIFTTTGLPSLTSAQIMTSTLSSSAVPSPTPEIFCSEDGIWKQTTACTTTTLQVCSPDHKTNG